MSDSDVQMHDATPAHTIKRSYDIYELPIRRGPIINHVDPFRLTDADTRSWLNDAFATREPPALSPNVEGKSIESENSAIDEFDMIICDEGDGSFVDVRTKLPDVEYCEFAERWFFDDFEKIVKSVFFNKGRIMLGMELLTQRYEEALSFARAGDTEAFMALISVIFEMKPQQILPFFEIMIHKIESTESEQEESAPAPPEEPGPSQKASSRSAKEPRDVKEEKDEDDEEVEDDDDDDEEGETNSLYTKDESLNIAIAVGIAHTLQIFRGEELDHLLAIGWNALVTLFLDLLAKTPAKQQCLHRTIHEVFQVIIEKGTRVEAILHNIRHDRELLRYVTSQWGSELPMNEEDTYTTAILLRIGKDARALEKLDNLILRAHAGFEDTTAEHIIRRIDVASDLSAHMPPIRRITRGDVDDLLTYRKLLFELRWMLRLLTSKRNPKVDGKTRQAQQAENPLFVRLILDDFFGEVTRVVRGKFVARFPCQGNPFRASAFECAHVLNAFYADSFQHNAFGGYALWRALEQGYMWHLMKLSAHILPEDSNSDLCKVLKEIVGHILPCFLIRTDVVEVAVNDFRKVYQQEDWDRIMASPLAEAWEKLKAVLLEREAHRYLYEQLKKVNKHVLSNICTFCLVPKEGITPKRCAGCKSVYYCSKACQLAAWKAEHKAECKKLEALVNSKGDTLDIIHFQEFCVRRDVARHRPGLEKKVEGTCGPDEASLSRKTVEIDYSCVPTRMRLKTVTKPNKPIPKDVLVCECRCLPGVESKPFYVYVPLSLLKGGVKERPDISGGNSKQLHRLCAQDEEGKDLKTVAWDVFDQRMAENNFGFAPWLTEHYPRAKREHRVQIFQKPVPPKEYDDDPASESEEEGTVKANDNSTEVPDADQTKLNRRQQRTKT